MSNQQICWVSQIQQISFSLMLVAAHVCGPTSNMSGPMGPNGPFLPVLGQQPRAPHFQALKMQNPNMQQCHATPHGPRNKDLELSVVPPHQPRPNTQLIVPDAHAPRAAHRAARGPRRQLWAKMVMASVTLTTQWKPALPQTAMFPTGMIATIKMRVSFLLHQNNVMN